MQWKIISIKCWRVTMNCKNCKYLKCYAINHQIYFCDNDNRIDDIGKLSVDKEPEDAPEWCPIIYISNLEQEAV